MPPAKRYHCHHCCGYHHLGTKTYSDISLAQMLTYLSPGCLTLDPGAPQGQHYQKEPLPSAHSLAQRGPQSDMARSLMLGPRFHSGGSRSPLLPPGPPQPKNTQQAMSVVEDGDETTWVQIV